MTQGTLDGQLMWQSAAHRTLEGLDAESAQVTLSIRHVAPAASA